MTEKIDWYREVLELEPNSKVFLPLARMLVQENALPEAIDALEKGLARHPEFLEARLFLIELLYKSGQKQKCDAQVQILSRMFSTYAGFWQAWAACLSSSGEDADAASALRFLAVQFLKGPTSLAKVINSGVAAIIGDSPKNAAVETGDAEPQETPRIEDEAQNVANEDIGSEDQPTASAPEETPAETPNEAPPGMDEAALEEETPPEEALPPQALEDTAPPEEPEDVEADTIETVGEELPAEAEKEEPGELPDAPEACVQAEAPAEVAAGLAQAAALARDLTPAEENEEPGEDSEEPESFSLRTKSMAEVLAAQGDIRGALDIYLELRAAAEGEEEDEIGKRVEELKALAAEPKPETGEAEKSPNNKDKLINILETLARRVEARASAPL